MTTFNVTDPQWYSLSPVTQAFIGIESSVMIFDLIVLGYILYHRNYLPFKIKQIHLVTISTFSGCCWWFGASAATRVFPQIDTPFFLVCSLWSVWAQAVFGVFLLISALLLRYLKLYIIIKRKGRVPLMKSVLLFMAFWTPAVILGIVLTAFGVDGPIIMDGVKICYFESSPFYGIMALLAIYLVLFFFFAISLRKPKQKYLEEYQETSWSVLVFVVGYIAYLLLQEYNLQYYTYGRIIQTLIVVGITQFQLYITVGVQVYNCFFHHKEYEERFKTKVAAFSHTASDSGNGTSTRSNIAMGTTKSKMSGSELDSANQ